MRYFVIGGDGNKYGPADLNTLQDWAKDNRLAPNTQVIPEGTETPLFAHQVPGLFGNPMPETPVYQQPIYVPPAVSPDQPAQPSQPEQPYGSQPYGDQPYGSHQGGYQQASFGQPVDQQKLAWFPFLATVAWCALAIGISVFMNRGGIIIAGFAVWDAFKLLRAKQTTLGSIAMVVAIGTLIFCGAKYFQPGS